MRELLRTLSLAPVESQHRVAVIDDAHLMTDSGKNAILKTLEEPNASVILILIAPSVDAVLPTIASRCQILNLRPSPLKAVAQALQAKGIERERAEFVARLSRGRVGWAMRAIEDESLLEERKTQLDALQEDGARQPHPTLCLRREISQTRRFGCSGDFAGVAVAMAGCGATLSTARPSAIAQQRLSIFDQ